MPNTSDNFPLSDRGPVGLSTERHALATHRLSGTTLSFFVFCSIIEPLLLCVHVLQGNDPATDLRGVGLFGLLQFLYLTCDQMLPLGLKLYKVANSESQPFPLAVLSLNLTNIVLNVFNTGKLNR